MSEWDDVEIEQEELPRGAGPQGPGLWPIAAIVGLLAFSLGFYFFFWKNRSAPEPAPVEESCGLRSTSTRSLRDRREGRKVASSEDDPDGIS